jgi:hypothetical protein
METIRKSKAILLFVLAALMAVLLFSVRFYVLNVKSLSEEEVP